MVDFLSMKQYETYLSPIQELLYQLDMNKMKQSGAVRPQDTGQDYDFRSIYPMLNAYSTNSHFPDYGKKPNHQTFSIESKYATGKNKQYAGRWNNNEFIQPNNKYPY